MRSKAYSSKSLPKCAPQDVGVNRQQRLLVVARDASECKPRCSTAVDSVALQPQMQFCNGGIRSSKRVA